jgi:glycosyltransferase involved in cell wall biosynthesis
MDFSIIIPVYNSEETIEELFNGIKKTFEDLGKSYEVIIVEDGSTDNSWKKLEYLKKDNPSIITIIKLTKNYGQHNATLCGFEYSTGDLLITIDDDLQIHPDEIKKLFAKYSETETDLIYGYFKKKRHSILRNLGSKFLKRSSKQLFKAPGEGSSFRLIRKELANNIIQHVQNFVFIDELLLWYTDNIDFVEVKHEKRRHQRSGYSYVKLFKIFTNIIVYYTAVPLRIMTYGGFFLSLISFLFGLRFIFRKIFLDVELGYTSLIVAILFSTSLILFCLGIIGEYLRRIYMVQNKKPPYSIKKIVK